MTASSKDMSRAGPRGEGLCHSFSAFCSDKHHNQKWFRKGEGVFILHFHVLLHHPGRLSQELLKMFVLANAQLAFIYLFLFVCVCMGVLPVCLSMHMCVASVEARRRCQIPQTEVADSCELP